MLTILKVTVFNFIDIFIVRNRCIIHEEKVRPIKAQNSGVLLMDFDVASTNDW